MNESFLHFVWKYQKFKNILRTTSDEEISIFYQGHHNHDSGPDFSEARLKIGALEWTGQVEIHIKSSDWDHHKHTADPAYNNVVLHVVWTDDKEILRNDGTTIPTLELQNLVDQELLTDYSSFINQPEEIPCKSHLSAINRITWIQNLDRMTTHRLEGKAERILAILHILNNDWEETTHRVLSGNFGFSLNAESFERLGESLPAKILSKHTNSIKQIEALIFGMAGFLDEPVDAYQKELSNEFRFLHTKYGLEQTLHRSHWKFGRMRPSNFPTVRLVQFASLYFSSKNIFSLFMEAESVKELQVLLNYELSDYWLTHYDFGKMNTKSQHNLGKSTFENLIINSISPLLAAYSIHTKSEKHMQKSLRLLEALPAENNRFVKKWVALDRSPKTAFDSQGLITLFQDFCTKKNCLNCGIGTAIFSK